jgi:uncharacterized membrane protein
MAEEKTEKELKAKKVSLIVKIVAIIFLVVCSILKWVGIFTNATIYEICMVAGTMSAIFGDISVNTAIDKFTQREESIL